MTTTGSSQTPIDALKAGKHFCRGFIWFTASIGILAFQFPSDAAALPRKAADLFQTTNVWTVHLAFTPKEWEALEPEGGPGGFGGGPGRGPGPGGFGPAMIVAPSFLKHGDENKDGKLSKEEFERLSEKWFGAWSKTNGGKLGIEQLRAGLNATLDQPAFGPPGGGPGRGGMNLQGPEGKRNGLASAMGVEFKYVHADLEFEGRKFSNVAVRYKGNGTFMQSRASLKRSFKVDLNEFVKGQKLAGVTKLNLQNDITDASWMNEPLSYRLFRDANVPAPRSAYARVYISVPGKHDRKYMGLYSLVENVDKHFIEEKFGTDKGAIFKPVTPNVFADLGSDWSKYNQTYDPKTDLSAAEKQRILDFCKLVSKANDAEFAAKLGDYVELDEFARFMAVTVWLSTLDSILGPGQNYYVYLHPRTHKFQFIPWDLDHSFGQFGMMGNQEQRENLDIHKPWRGENRFLERVFKTDAFRKTYLARLAEFNKTIFQPARFHQQVNEVAAVIRPAVKEESEIKLARFDKVVAGETVEPLGMGGESADAPAGGRNPQRARPEGPGRFMQPSKPIKGFVTARTQSVADQLAGKSKGESIEGFGFGGGGRGGGPGGPGNMGPGNFLAPAFMGALDTNNDEMLTKNEFTRGFAKWFEGWDTAHSGVLSDEQLRAGINQQFSPFRGGPGGPRPGPGNNGPPGGQ